MTCSRITLRTLTIEYVQAHLECLEEVIIKYLNYGKPSNLEDVRTWITDEVIPAWKEDDPKLSFVIVENISKKIKGNISIDLTIKQTN